MRKSEEEKNQGMSGGPDNLSAASPATGNESAGGNAQALGRSAALVKTTVTSQYEVAPGAFFLRYPRSFGFIPGQIVALTTDLSIPPRYYSIASGEDDPQTGILYTVVDEGELTPKLSSLREGDTLYVSQPSGGFTDGGDPAWWIAAGTGVAPFASMVKSGMTAEKVLVHGSRTLAAFYFSEIFSSALGSRYIRCCSGESAPGVFSGRLTAWLEMRERFPAGARYFLCGSNAMVVDVRDILIARGVPFERIVSEIYF